MFQKPSPNKSRNNNVKETKEFEEEVMQIDRVTRVVKGGRRMRFRALVAIGNKKGKIGIGVGKANEVMGAIKKAIRKSQKNMINIPLFNGTIPHEVRVKYKSAKIILMPAGPGTGIIAGGSLRKIAELAGIKNILSKALGTRNKIANSRAMFEALTQLQPIHKEKKEETNKKIDTKKPPIKQPEIKKSLPNEIKSDKKLA